MFANGRHGVSYWMYCWSNIVCGKITRVNGPLETEVGCTDPVRPKKRRRLTCAGVRYMVLDAGKKEPYVIYPHIFTPIYPDFINHDGITVFSIIAVSKWSSRSKSSAILLPRLPTRLKCPIPQSSQPLCSTLTRCNESDVMSQRGQESRCLIVVIVFKAHRIRLQLIVQSRLLQALRDCLTPVQHVPEILDGGRDDAAAASGSDDIVQGIVGLVLDDRPRNGGKGPFAGFDEIGWGGRITEGVGLAGNREVVHFVVHDDTGLWNHELGAEEGVDGRGQRDRETRRVSRDYVRCTPAVQIC